MDNRPVGIFDSGVGGLSILAEVAKLLPKESFIYVADQKNIPYGAKSSDQLKKLTENIVAFLLKQNVKMVIVGCNTATVYTLEYLRDRFSLPMVGIVPVVKTLSEVSQAKKIGVLSTLSTSKSSYLEKLIADHAADCEVFVSPGVGLVELVESGITSGPEVEGALKNLVEPMLAAGVDSIALGCSHYPFLRDALQKLVGQEVKILDSGAAVARQVKRILENNKQLADVKKSDIFYTTGDVWQFRVVAEKLLAQNLNEVYLAEIN